MNHPRITTLTISYQCYKQKTHLVLPGKEKARLWPLQGQALKPLRIRVLFSHVVCYSKHLGFPGGSVVMNPPAGDLGLDLRVRKIPWRRKWQPTPVLWPGKSHGQRSLVGYSAWGRRKLDFTQQLKQHLNTKLVKGCYDHLHPPFHFFSTKH